MGTAAEILTTKNISSNGKYFSFDKLKEFQKNRKEPKWLEDFRRYSFDIAGRIAMPDRKDEIWRRTDIRSFDWKIFAYNFAVPQRIESIDSLPAPLPEYRTIGDKPAGGVLIHLDGERYFRSLNPELEKAGVIFLPLSEAVREYGDLIEKYFMKEGVPPGENIFTALHGAFWNNGVFLYVPKGVVIEAPLAAVNAVETAGIADFSHTLLIAEERSRVTLLHDQVSMEGGTEGLHNGAVEIFTGKAANVEYYQLQDWDPTRWNFSSERTRVYRDGNITWVSGAIGGKVNKIHQMLDLVESGASGEMLGMEFIHGKQHVDYYTQQNHEAPHTTSNLLYRAALTGESRSIWRGNIRVFPKAQKTDGYQANHNLLLNPDARSDSIPGLEIEADDVRCTHGSTAGNIEDEHIFYLRSRGLSKREAEKLVVTGFFEPVIDKFKNESIQEKYRRAIEREIARYGTH